MLLSKTNRDKVVSGSRDLERNFADCGWAIRLHLSRVATFNFQCRSGDPGLNRDIEGFMAWWSRPKNCDIAGRFSLPEITQTLEKRAVVDGDCWVAKLSDGKVQLIDADCVRTPTDGLPNSIDKDALVHGTLVTPSGALRGITISRRGKTKNSFDYETFIPSQFIYQHGYFDFANASQIRGTSPLLSALNNYRDLYENQEFALARQKLAQIFALAMYRGEEAEPLSDVDSNANLNLQGDGPAVLDLDHGEKVEAIESRTPGDNYIDFQESVLRSALKSLDIPYSLYHSLRSSFSASRLDLQVYESTCLPKRNRVKRILDQLTAWRLGLAIEDGVIDIGSRRLSDLNWDWLSPPLPVIDASKEAKAEAQSLENKTTSLHQLCKARGLDWMQIADELIEEEEYMKNKRKEKGLENNSGE